MRSIRGTYSNVVNRYDSMSSKRRLSLFSNRFTALEAAISSWLT